MEDFGREKNMNTNIKINFVFEFGVNNGSMSLVMRDNEHVLSNIPEANGLVEVDTQINFPNQIIIDVSGKNPNTDTTVVNGEIVADKYIRLASMTVGGIPISEVTLFKILKYTHGDNISTDPYWGFNGRIVIDFNYEDFIKWHLSHQNVFDLV